LVIYPKEHGFKVGFKRSLLADGRGLDILKIESSGLGDLLKHVGIARDKALNFFAIC